MTEPSPADTLRAAGEALLGPSWPSSLAKLLDVDKRRLERMAAGKAEVPAGILYDAATICEACAGHAQEERASRLRHAVYALRKAADVLFAAQG